MKPRNCSKCRQSPIVEHAIVKGNLCFMVVCPTCRRHSTLCFQKKNAIAEWNTRPERE